MTFKVDANPVMIKWAREDAGFKLEELPDNLKDAEKWETGQEKPTWTDLTNMAEIYKRPSFFYFLSQPPKEDKDLIEFRSDEKIEEYSSALRLEIRKAKSRRNAYIRINENMGMKIPDFSQYVSKEEDYLELGQYIRNLLNVDFKTQKSWIFEENGNIDNVHNGFLEHWREILFNMGILVFEIKGVQESEISGCSLYYDNCPIILLNGMNHCNIRIFTLMHELTHLIQGKSTICDVDKYNVKESFCNKVAAEILIPKKTLDDLDLTAEKINDLTVYHLSNIYGVSEECIVYKLHDSGLINDKLKNDLIVELEYDNEDTGGKLCNDSSLSISAVKRKYDGIPFTRLVLEAYENKVITSTEAMRFLDSSLDDIEELDLDINR